MKTLRDYLEEDTPFLYILASIDETDDGVYMIHLEEDRAPKDWDAGRRFEAAATLDRAKELAVEMATDAGYEGPWKWHDSVLLGYSIKDQA